MDLQIALLLGQDGIVNGAVYGLMALALVLVFSVTRVIFIPQGEFVAFGALSMAALQGGRTPATLWLLVALGVMALAVEVWRWKRGATIDWRSAFTWCVAFPAIAAVLVLGLKPTSMTMQAVTTLVLIAPLGPLLYRLAYRPLADATVLMLLIVSVALHGVLVGLGLFFFGAEGSRTTPFSDVRFDIGGIPVSGQSLVVVGVTLLLVIAMFWFFGRSMVGKALRATAINRVGARLSGIPTELSGDLSFALAALIGAVSGLLIAPITTVYYDTGFLIGLKGFVAAIVGGLASYPLALAGALLVGLLEAFSSFWASAYKEVLVFTLIIPVLWWRSLRSHHVEDEE
ncbi:High-affinity branched-chain amino acid transport system permease protein LivH [compost metagenome]|uniref:Branched-chain amino acid ABC transporter permease n=1 Tax=Variovorax boronicumulans TaxID=436515 RepID=A0A1E7U254_9BURK|nr:branched-chain amino acid ABC transporter permease [Variovorax boronicumulans]ATA52924.1 branched-chain amino acid ABC transporter permease [Variovorax boronicumulans]MDP9878715.1 branched-chain amino acid transport system permease protein [Variovorax boronicumulans]MDP9913065.1 branched-chain amino acid transport system permease protein [Variovorax boronicumulans]MDP9916338.1 branched-chain amino acid transport system permease protein [Variovorax boronicumulans]MDP9923999.1 branched-chain 